MVWVPSPKTSLRVLDQGKLFGMTTVESEDGFCSIMLISPAGRALGVAGGGIRTRAICFENSKPKYCARVVQLLIGSGAEAYWDHWRWSVEAHQALMLVIRQHQMP